MALGCGSFSADAGGCDVSGSTAGTAVNSSHITQVKVPKRDDGRWMSVGALIGLALGYLTNKGAMDKAKKAEDTWRTLTDDIRDMGLAEKARADALQTCDAALWEKYCAFANCGYKPDYAGILNRARADAAFVAGAEIKSALRQADRYNTGLNANVLCDIRRAEVFATVGAVVTAREEERKTAFSLNFNLLDRAATRVEDAYQNRLKLGADFMASAGANYASLAASLRQTAKDDKGDWALLGSMLGALLPMLMNSSGCPAALDCGC